MQELKAFGRLMIFSFRALFGWMNPAVYGASMVVLPVFHILFFALLGRFSEQGHSLDWHLVGNAIQVCAYTSIYAVGGSLNQDRWSGTLSLVLIAPRSKMLVFAGRSLVLILHGLVTVALGFAVCVAVFGLDLSGAHWGGLMATVLLTTLSTGCLGLLVAALSLVIPQMNMTNNMIMAVLMLLCGVNFAQELLPAPVQVLSQALPLARGVAAARLLVSGTDLAQAGALMAGEAMIGLVYLAAGYVLFIAMERRARVEGTLDLY